MATCPYPIAVMSFNRPDLLKEVLKSIKSQTIGLDESHIYLFQDGVRSRFSSEESIAPDESHQNECVRVFQEIFPSGQAFQSSVNLGVALNFDRAERLFFEELKAECGLFFEDDLLLSPYYLEALLQLTEFALSEPLVSYVAAFGDHSAGLENQHFYSTKIIRMTHNWGFGLTRRQWLQQRKIVDGYLSIVREYDYSARHHERIEEYFSSLGFSWGATSQDAAKGVAGLVLGTTRLMCLPCFGRYIGQNGLHFTPDLYFENGYDKTILFDQPPPQFVLPKRSQLMHWVEEERKFCRGRLVGFTEEAQFGDQLLFGSVVEFIESLYHYLLGRPADREGLINWAKFIFAGYSPSDLIRVFVNSAEFKSQFFAVIEQEAIHSKVETQNSESLSPKINL